MFVFVMSWPVIVSKLCINTSDMGRQIIKIVEICLCV